MKQPWNPANVAAALREIAQFRLDDNGDPEAAFNGRHFRPLTVRRVRMDLVEHLVQHGLERPHGAEPLDILEQA